MVVFVCVQTWHLRSKINSVKLHKNDRNIFFTASDDKTAKMWDLRTIELVVKTFKGHLKGLTQLEFDDVNNRLITSSLDKTVKIWDVRNEKEIRSFTGHTLGIYSLAFDQTKLITGADDKNLIIWDFNY